MRQFLWMLVLWGFLYSGVIFTVLLVVEGGRGNGVAGGLLLTCFVLAVWELVNG